MAVLKKHGVCVGTIDYINCSVKYMENGNVLRNQGFGWKLYASCKDGVTPTEAFEKAAQRQTDRLARAPAMAAFRRTLFAACSSVKYRWQLVAAIQAMPDDPDGVWSTCDDHGFSLMFEDIVKLCRLYKVMMAERKAEMEKAVLAA